MGVGAGYRSKPSCFTSACEGIQGQPRLPKEELRSLFIEQAKKYLDVPYAKRFCSPGTAAYDSALFLDCCGLVRRVMRDLQSEFGFTIKGWNQNYVCAVLCWLCPCCS